MDTLGLAPDLVLVSSALRTRQTLELLEPWADTPLVEPLDTLYLATAPVILKTLHAVPETVRSVLLVGHNPGLHEFAVQLVGAHAMTYDNADQRQLAGGFPSGALTEFTIAGPWGTLNEGGGRLVRFLCPRDLPSDGG